MEHITRDAVDPRGLSAGEGEPCEPPPVGQRSRHMRVEEAMRAGTERVKGLLRTYEAGELEQSADQGRAPFSFQFLWDGLGLER